MNLSAGHVPSRLRKRDIPSFPEIHDPRSKEVAIISPSPQPCLLSLFLVPVVFFDCAKLGIDDFHREKKSPSSNFFHIATNAQNLGCSLS
jgi:hypothetical protein